MLAELHCPAKWQENQIRGNNSRVTLNETRMFKKEKKKSADESYMWGPPGVRLRSSPWRILDVTCEEASAAGIGRGSRGVMS